MSNHHLTFSLFLFFLCGPTYGFITHRPLSSSSLSSPSDLISYGVHDRYFVLDGLSAESSTCDQTYGFLPCTTTVIGNIFLIAVYGYLLFMSASYLSRGSELLLQILGPGIIGGLFLPILGALPDALLILGAHFFILILLFAFLLSVFFCSLLFGSRESCWEKWGKI